MCVVDVVVLSSAQLGVGSCTTWVQLLEWEQVLGQE